MFATTSVEVLRKVDTGEEDILGNPVMADAEPETVDGCLVAPGGTSDTELPDGVRVAVSVHFPKGYTDSLRGCDIRIPGWGTFHVIGDPKPYMPGNTPGPWWMVAECEATDG